MIGTVMMIESGMRGVCVTGEPLNRASESEVGMGCGANLGMAAAYGLGVGATAEVMRRSIARRVG